jgi:MFS family permease
MVSYLGARNSYIVAMASVVPMCLILGFVGIWVPSSLVWTVTIGSAVVLGFAEGIAYLCVIIMISDSVEPNALGSAHGLASTCAAGVRTVSPPLAGYLWELGIRREAPWIVFLVIAGVSLAACGAAMLGTFVVLAENGRKRGDVAGGDSWSWSPLDDEEGDEEDRIEMNPMT